ncbi:hypothetical protein C8046_11525 [Serinibacter arcticus]|uniref:IrrE N-terminal-like domain-containing protein n=1 Tax=Serinibacter arcticus TaxID=1655435 RepID=A0A2U1ZW17_9MICO|nr:ImmA/IrrE family metallo-endopeptidase [Serinibacter arcticus]PWD51185.1 hypothetical protein C8046_11525 [Serinibacter arcticus]
MTAPPAPTETLAPHPRGERPAPHGRPIQEDLLAGFALPAGGIGPGPREHLTREKLERKRRRLLELTLDAVEFGKEPSVSSALRAAWQFWPRFSTYNGLLLLCQRPSATHVETPSTWQHRYGMVALPNEQPLLVLNPGGPLHFVLDASQVEPGPDPGSHAYEPHQPFARRTFDAAPQVLATMIESIKVHGVRVVDHRLGQSRGGHLTTSRTGATQDVVTSRRPLVVAPVPVRFELALNADLSPTEKLAVLAHELGHLYCGHLGPDPALLQTGEGLWLERLDLDAEQKEAEAEFVSDAVMRFVAPGATRLRPRETPELLDTPELPDHGSAVVAALAVELVLDTIQAAAL